MRTARRLMSLGGPVAAAAGLAVVLAASVAVAPQAASRPQSAASTVVTDNPWTYQMTNAAPDGLVVRGVANGTGQIFQIFDPFGNPIFSVPPFGGPSVFGDNLRVFHPGSVFNQSLTLHFDGSITVGQQVGSDAAPVNQGGPTIYGGSADPNAKPPVHQQADATGQPVNRPLVVGDWYLRSGAGYGLYVWTGSRWLKKL